MTDSRPSLFKIRYFLYVLLVPTVVFAAHLALSWGYYSGPLVETTDLAVQGIQVERAAHFRQLVGPYSRFKFHHPGPISSYYYAFTAPAFPVVPTPLGRHLLAQLLLNLAFLIVALHCAYSLARQPSATLLFAAAFFAVFARSNLGADALANVWSPYALIFPMLAFVPAVAAVALGNIRYVLPATLAAVFIAHNHVSGILIVAPIFGAALYACYVRRRATAVRRSERVTVALASALLLVTSAPALIDQVFCSEGNLSNLCRFFYQYGGQHRTLGIAGHFIAGYFKAPFAFLHVNGEIVLGLVILGCLLGWRHFGGFERAVSVVTASAVSLSIISASRVFDTMYGYMFLYEIPLVAIGIFLALVALRAHRFGVPWLLVAGASALFISGTAMRSAPHDERVPAIVQFVRPRPDVRYELFWRAGGEQHEQWHVAAGVALALLRAGAHPCVPAEWQFMFERDMSPCSSLDQRLPLERVTFYERHAYRQQVRERAATFGATTVETGRMRPVRLPITFDASSSDDYFDGSLPAIRGARTMQERVATVHFVLADAPLPPEVFMRITTEDSGGCEAEVSVNGTRVGMVRGPGGVAEFVVAASWLRRGQDNTVAVASACGRNASEQIRLESLALGTRPVAAGGH